MKHDIKELKDIETLVFRNVNGKLCAYLVKETFAGYLDQGKDGEKITCDGEKITCGFEVKDEG